MTVCRQYCCLCWSGFYWTSLGIKFYATKNFLLIPQVVPFLKNLKYFFSPGWYSHSMSVIGPNYSHIKWQLSDEMGPSVAARSSQWYVVAGYRLEQHDQTECDSVLIVDSYYQLYEMFSMSEDGRVARLLLWNLRRPVISRLTEIRPFVTVSRSSKTFRICWQVTHELFKTAF